MNAIAMIDKEFSLEEPLTEIINADEVMTPSPLWIHQIIAKKLYKLIDRYVEVNGLGELYFSPLDVIFEEGENRLQPDLLFIRKENMPEVKDWVRCVPDMVSEIVSTGTYLKDTVVKKEIYEKYGVAEYWIVIPELKIVEILAMADGKYTTHSIAEGSGVVNSKAIAGLQIDIRDIFG
jgi:Uma2 family endonuclease